MTLIAGFVCPDGFVVAGDTEVQLGDLRFQTTKLIDSPATNASYRLVIGGAGWSDYLDEVMQEIVDDVSRFDAPVIVEVDQAIRDAIGRIHDQNIFQHWEPGDPARPAVGLIVGLRDATGHRCVWKTADKTVSRVSGCSFVGTGTMIAVHVSEKLFRDGLPTAMVHHLATQILREAKLKCTGVGGNTDTWSVQTADAAPYFDISSKDKRYLLET